MPTQEYDWIHNPIMRTGVLRQLGNQLSSLSIDLDPEDEVEEGQIEELDTKVKSHITSTKESKLNRI